LRKRIVRDFDAKLCSSSNDPGPRPTWWPDGWNWPHDPNADPLCLRALEDVPKTEEVHHPHTAFNQGWASYEGSCPRTCNPYRGKDDDLKESWDDGYQAAKDEEEFDDWES